MVLLPSVLEENMKAVKNGLVQLGGCKNPWRVNTAQVPSLSVLKRKQGGKLEIVEKVEIKYKCCY